MSKRFIALALCTICSIGQADISIIMRNHTVGILERGATNVTSETLLDPGSLVQVVWSPSPISYQVDHVPLSLTRPGEIILHTYTADVAGLLLDGSAYVYGNADVRGQDIASGYVWARLWEAQGGYGEYFLESGILNPVISPYTPIDPRSIHIQDIFSSESYVLGIDTGVYNGQASISALGTQAIPEPSTVGLMLLSGGCLYFFRKKGNPRSGTKNLPHT